MTVNAAQAQELIPCAECGVELPQWDMADVEGYYYCGPCYRDNFVVCSHCQEDTLIDNTVEVAGEYWCEYCADRYAVRCEDCNELIPEEDAHVEGYTAYCESCWEEREREEDIIYAWNDGPPTRFFSLSSNATNHYYGIEIEVEREASSLTRGEMAKKVIDAGAGHVYCKEDGSLKCGFEVVSHAADYEYHLEKLPWKEILDCLREAGYRSHDPGTCGFHIHISREAFGQDQETQLDRIHRLLYIVEKFWPYWLKFSRRNELSMQHWAARYLGEDEHLDRMPKETLLDRAIYGSKYHAVNLQKPRTVEIRMFRGTLKLSTLRATLQLVHYLVGLATNDDIDLEKITWDDIANNLKNLTPELKTYMEERRL